MLIRLVRRMKEGGSFIEVFKDDTAENVVVFEGQIDKPSETKVTELPVTDEMTQKVAELYRGPDDPRLPSDVQELPVGRKEDFVDEFNEFFFWYFKDEDPEYDENKREAENAVRYALSKAYNAISQSTPSSEGKGAKEGADPESGKPESSISPCTMVTESGKTAHRIRESVMGIVVPESLKESNEPGEGDVDVVIIREGWSLNERHYGSQALDDIVTFINESKPGFMNHGRTYDRDPRDWAVALHSAERMDDRVIAKMHIFDYPDGSFLKERVSKFPNMFGGSIDAFAMIEEGEVDGREGQLVTNVVELVSWDVVMFPAAGGTIHGKESIQSNKENQGMDIATLKEKYPDLFRLVCEQAVSEQKSKTDQLESEKEALEQKNRDLQAELDGLKTAEKVRKDKAEFEEKVRKLVGDTFEEDEVSEEFVGILLEEGPKNYQRVEKMVKERRATLDKIPTGVSETKENEDDSTTESQVADDDAELARFAA